MSVRPVLHVVSPVLFCVPALGGSSGRFGLVAAGLAAWELATVV